MIKDDAIQIAEKMHDTEVIAFATPIYYYEMSGQMKTLLDRANSLYGSDYRFEDIYLLSSAAEDEEGVDRRAIGGLEGWIECFGEGQNWLVRYLLAAWTPPVRLQAILR